MNINTISGVLAIIMIVILTLYPKYRTKHRYKIHKKN